jgi:hypothetical protein
LKSRVAAGSALVITLLLVSGTGVFVGTRFLNQAGSTPAASTTTTTTTTTMTTISDGNGSTVLVLSVNDGVSVSPATLSGYGQAAWDGSSNTCTMSSAPYAPGPLCISDRAGGCTTPRPLQLFVVDKGVTLVVNTTVLAVYSRLDNYGVIKILPSVPWACGQPGCGPTSPQLVNYGVIDNYGSIYNDHFIINLPFGGAGTINNFKGGVIVNALSIDNGGSVVNLGEFVNNGTVTNCETGSSWVSGTFTNGGTLSGGGSMQSCADLRSQPPLNQNTTAG